MEEYINLFPVKEGAQVPQTRGNVSPTPILYTTLSWVYDNIIDKNYALGYIAVWALSGEGVFTSSIFN